jgi:hypothetical protein
LLVEGALKSGHVAGAECQQHRRQPAEGGVLQRLDNVVLQLIKQAERTFLKDRRIENGERIESMFMTLEYFT